MTAPERIIYRDKQGVRIYPAKVEIETKDSFDNKVRLVEWFDDVGTMLRREEFNAPNGLPSVVTEFWPGMLDEQGRRVVKTVVSLGSGCREEYARPVLPFCRPKLLRRIDICSGEVTVYKNSDKTVQTCETVNNDQEIVTKVEAKKKGRKK